eukprot:gene17710-23898_t
MGASRWHAENVAAEAGSKPSPRKSIGVEDVAPLRACGIVAAMVIVTCAGPGGKELIQLIDEKMLRLEQEYLANRSCMRKFVEHSVFNAFVMFITVFNIMVMCMDHHNKPAWCECFINMANFAENFNCFDCFLVVISLPSLIPLFMGVLPTCKGGGGGMASSLRAFRIFRMARVLRVFRLVRRWRSLKEI